MPKSGANKCGCNCSNASEYAPCGEEHICCASCPNGLPCMWALLFGCYGECSGLEWQPITVLPKECLFDCEWTARAWPNGGGGYTLPWPGGKPCDTPCGEAEDEYTWINRYFPPVWGKAGGLGGGGTELEWRKLDFTCCKPLDPLSYLFDATGHCSTGAWNGSCDPPDTDDCVRCGWRDYYHLEYAYNIASYCPVANIVDLHNAWLDQSRVMWRLTIDSANAVTLLGYTDGFFTTRSDEYIIVYETSDFDCDEERFTLTRTDTNDICKILPKKVCLAKYSSHWKTHCETTQQACNCKDPGWSTGYTTLQTDCAPLNGETVCMTRITGGANPIPCITAPTPAPCGYFYGWMYVDLDCDGDGDNTLHVVTWCDGNEDGWHTRIYCETGTTGNGASCTLVCDVDCTLSEFCPDGAVLSFLCSSFGDCCPDCPLPPCTDCGGCGCDIPATLHVTMDFAACADIDGKVITLTWDGAFNWIGDFDGGACGGAMRAIAALDTGSCSFIFTIYSDNTIATVCFATPLTTLNLCDLDGSGSASWQNGTCPCCTGTATATMSV